MPGDQSRSQEAKAAIREAVVRARTEVDSNRLAVLSSNGIADLLGLSVTQVARAKKEGKLVPTKEYAYSEAAILEFAEKYLETDLQGKLRVNRNNSSKK